MAIKFITLTKSMHFEDSLTEYGLVNCPKQSVTGLLLSDSHKRAAGPHFG